MTNFSTSNSSASASATRLVAVMLLILCSITSVVCPAAAKVRKGTRNGAKSVDLEHADWGDVVRKLNGKVQHPIELDGWFVTVLALLCSVAFQPNVELFMRIAGDKTLCRKPRCVIQLFTICSSLFTLYTNVVQCNHFFVKMKGKGRRDAVLAEEELCHFFVSIFGVSYGTFMLNNLASLVECFVFLTFPLWHEEKVTVRRVVYWLIGLNSALVGAMKWPFLSGALPVRCAIQGLHNSTLQVILFFLFVSCFVFLVADFILIWRLLPRAAANTVPTPSINSRNRCNRLSTVNHQQQQHQNDTLHRLELEAIRSFLIGAASLLFLLPFPPLILFSSFQFICPQLNQVQVCNDLTWLYPYAPVMMTVHALVSPILSLRYNTNFASPSPLRPFPIAFLLCFCCFFACSLFNVIAFV